MTSDPTAGSEDVTHPLPAETLAILRDYLDRAPLELAEWAHEQKVLLPEPVSDPATEPVTPDEDESEDFYNDMEGEDDILQLRRTPGSKRARAPKPSRARQSSVRPGAKPHEDSAGTSVGTGASSEPASSEPATSAPTDTSAPASGATTPRGWRNLSAGRRMALVVLLMAGIIGGVKFAGMDRGANTTSANTAAGSSRSIGTGAPEVDSATRIADLTAAIEQNPEAVEERLELGVLYFNDRRIEDAQELWLEVTELAPQDVAAWYNLGFSYLSMDPAQPDAAHEAWQHVIELDPDSEMALTVTMHMQGQGGADSEQDPAG